VMVSLMTWRGWMKLLLSVCGMLLLLLGIDRIQMIAWVGSTDLEIEFAVANARTSAPVPGARIEIQSEGGFYEERDKQEFVLVTDVSGIAQKLCRRSMCFGRQSLLGFTDTFAVHLPFWRYRVGAEGFNPTAWTDLDVIELRRQVQRVGSGKAKLVISVLVDHNAAVRSLPTDRPRE
jgi:hypothetical protein